jgi:hypothetical protein
MTATAAAHVPEILHNTGSKNEMIPANGRREKKCIDRVASIAEFRKLLGL